MKSFNFVGAKFVDIIATFFTGYGNWDSLLCTS